VPYARVSREAEVAIETLLKLAQYVELRDHIPGRIVTRVSFSHIPQVVGLLQGLDVNRGLQLIPGLKDYEVSAWSRSAAITYDPTVLPMDLWNDFRTIRNDPSLEGAVRKRLYALFENHSGSGGE
jgi:hypothetical protein